MLAIGCVVHYFDMLTVYDVCVTGLRKTCWTHAPS